MSHWLSRQRRFVLAAFVVLTAAGVFPCCACLSACFPRSISAHSGILEAGDRPADQMVVQVTRPAEEALRAIPGVRQHPLPRPAAAPRKSQSRSTGARI